MCNVASVLIIRHICAAKPNNELNEKKSAKMECFATFKNKKQQVNKAYSNSSSSSKLLLAFEPTANTD